MSEKSNFTKLLEELDNTIEKYDNEHKDEELNVLVIGCTKKEYSMCGQAGSPKALALALMCLTEDSEFVTQFIVELMKITSKIDNKSSKK